MTGKMSRTISIIGGNGKPRRRTVTLPKISALLEPDAGGRYRIAEMTPAPPPSRPPRRPGAAHYATRRSEGQR
jgi:hypothetical protein